MKVGIKILRNIFSMWSYYILAMLIGFFLMPFMILRLGQELYGMWMLALSLIGYMFLLDFGLAHSATKYIAEYKTFNDQTKLNRMMSTFFFSYILLGLLIIMIAGFLAIFFDSFFNVNVGSLSILDLKLCVFILGLSLALTFCFTPFTGLIKGWQRYDLTSLAEFVVLITKTGLIVLALILGFDLVALALVTLISTLLGQLCRLVFARKLNPNMKISIHLFDKLMLKKIFNYSIFSFIISSSSLVLFNLGQVIIGVFLSPVMVTFYVVGARLPLLIRPFVSAITGVLVPTVSDFNAKKNRQRIEQLLISGTKYSLIVVFPVAIFLIAFRQPFIELWIGKGYELSMKVLAILFFTQIIYLSQNAANSILFGLGKLKFKAILSVSEIAVCIILSIVLVKRYGVIGVALALAIPLSITNLLIFPKYICRVIKTPFFNYIKSTVLILLPITLVYIFGIFYLRKFLVPNSLILLGLEFAICVLFYLVAAYCCGLKKWERESFIGYAKIFLRAGDSRKKEYAKL